MADYTGVLGSLRIELSANIARFTTGMAAATKVAEKTFKSLAASGKRLESVGKSLSMYVTAPVLAMAGLALKAGGDFQQAMQKVKAESGATAEQMKLLSRAALTIGPAFNLTGTEAAPALESLAEKGYAVEQAVATLPAVLRLAKAESMELGDAVDTVADITRGFNLRIGDAEKATDLLMVAAGEAGQNTKEFAGELAKLAPNARAAGLNLKTTAAAMAVMEKNGIRGEKAGKALKSIFETLTDTGDALAGQLASAGISFRDAAGNLMPFEDILDRLRPKANDAAWMWKTFGQDAGTAMASLATSGSKGLKAMEAVLDASGGTTAKAAKDNMAGFNEAMKRLGVAVNGLQIAIADSGLLDWATQIVQRLTGLVQNLAQANPQMLRFGVIAALAAAALGPLVALSGMVMTKVAGLGLIVMKGVGLIGAAISGLGTLLMGLVTVLGGLFMMPIGELLAAPLVALSGALASLGGAIGGVVGWLTGLVMAIAPAVIGVGAMVLAWEAWTGVMKSWNTGEANSISTWFSETFPNAQKAMESALDSIEIGWQKFKLSMGATLTDLGTWKDGVLAKVDELISGVKGKFAQLQNVMAHPADAAATAVLKSFIDMTLNSLDRSPIPDLINGIKEWFGRLKGIMGPAAEAGSKAVLEVLGKLKDAAGPAVEELMKELTAQLDRIAPIVAAPGLGEFAKSPAAVANSTLGGQDNASAAPGATAGGFEELADEGEKATNRIAEAFNSMSADVGRNLGDLFSKGELSFKSFKSTLADGLRSLSSSFMSAAFGGFGQRGQRSGLFGGLQNLMGFAGGGSFTVPGSGLSDSKLAAFRVSPGETVDIRKPGQDMGGRSTIVQHLNFHPGVPETVRLEIMRAVPAIRQSTLAAVADKAQRGGGFARSVRGR